MRRGVTYRLELGIDCLRVASILAQITLQRRAVCFVIAMRAPNTSMGDTEDVPAYPSAINNSTIVGQECTEILYANQQGRKYNDGQSNRSHAEYGFCCTDELLNCGNAVVREISMIGLYLSSAMYQAVRKFLVDHTIAFRPGHSPRISLGPGATNLSRVSIHLAQWADGYAYRILSTGGYQLRCRIKLWW